MDGNPVMRLDDPFHLVVFWSPFGPSCSKQISAAVQLLAARGAEVIAEGPAPDAKLTAAELKDMGRFHVHAHACMLKALESILQSLFPFFLPKCR